MKFLSLLFLALSFAVSWSSEDAEQHRNLEDPANMQEDIDQAIQVKNGVSYPQEEPGEFRYWLLEDYPNPEDLIACGGKDNNDEKVHRLCDPDLILSPDESNQVTESLAAVRRSASLCETEETDASIEIQFAIALAQKMDLSPFGPYDDRADRAAEVFAREIHNEWGVGMETKCGGTGALLFLSTMDRVVYISRGKALEPALTDARLDRTIENMKPFLRKGKYKEALLHAVEELDSWIQKGPPERMEQIKEFILEYSGLFWIGSLFSYVMWVMWGQRIERRRYARVAGQLDEIDRARAQALQGQYKAESCPICLEPFCKETNTSPSEDDSSQEQNPTIGSDGRPIKLLRCGHVFDESCWEEWVESGQGQVDKCPICKHDIGSAPPQPEDETVPNIRTGQDNVEDNNNNDPSDNDNNQQAQQRNQAVAEERRHREQRALRQYNYERQFRLARLGRRYPQYVGQQQIARWTQSTYNGALVRDPAFVQSNPTLRAANSGGRNSHGGNLKTRGGGSSGFGGGSSAGGRAGRW